MKRSSRFSFAEKDLFKLTGHPSISNWTKFLEAFTAELPGEWIYRGLNDKEPEGRDCITLTIESSFDREFSNLWLDDREKNQWDFRWAHEAHLLREFKRAAHHFRTDLPAPSDFLEWLSLGRHFEMPCRLLDFSYSFWVAAYFSLSGKSSDRFGYVLAISLDWLNKNIENLQKEHLDSKKYRDQDFHNPKHFHWFAFSGKCPFKEIVVPVVPGRKNERLIAQQGLFLCQGDIDLSFAEALRQTIKKAPKDKKVVRLIVLPSKWRSFILEELLKTNVKGSVLFPDLQGFGQSLRDNFHRPINDNTSERFLSELEVSISCSPRF